MKRTRERLTELAGLARKEAKRETFAEAVARLGLSGAQLLHTQQGLELKAAVWFALCAVAFVFLVMSVVSVHPVSQAALSIGVMALARPTRSRPVFAPRKSGDESCSTSRHGCSGD
ncbi:hypothetical protein [Burkholderia multivorans]|uniref:hypothetical protein n=1 Tax=Burkholderia multivorans TaxID=87883 RepID=UPI00286FBE8C|nr:hypothetical protein [Burkholderia multivorans]